MNEPTTKDSILIPTETHAYQKYVEQAKKYTQPLSFKNWLDDILNFRFGC